jgi:hypothetical protein
MQTGMVPKPWPLWKAPNDPNRISFDPLLYSVVLQVSENPVHRKPSFRESHTPEARFPRMEGIGSSVNTASSRSYTGGYGPVEPGPIGPGLGGFPRISLLGFSVDRGIVHPIGTDSSARLVG